MERLPVRPAAEVGSRAQQVGASVFEDWQLATATVIVANTLVASGSDNAGMPSHTDLVLEIAPVGGPAFRAEAKINYLGFNLPMRHYIPPMAGETVHVEFDTKSQKVRVVLDDAHDSRVAATRSTAAAQAALHAIPGSGIGAEQQVPVTRAEPSAGGASGILRDGIDCQATVLAAFPLGQKTSTGEDATALILLVTAPGSPPFQAQVGMYVPPAATHLLAPGTTVPARALPGQLQMVAIDWAALIAAGR